MAKKTGGSMGGKTSFGAKGASFVTPRTTGDEGKLNPSAKSSSGSKKTTKTKGRTPKRGK